VKEEFGLNGAVITPDWREVVRSKDVDVVHVCTPNPLHYEITMAAFENGKHVHCEKPIALNYQDAKTMADTAKAAHLKFTTGTQWRYNPAPMRMKQMVKDGVFGDIFYIKSQQLRPRRLPAYGVYTSKELNGGGVLMDGGPHSIDLPMWLTDNYEVDSVRGVTFDKMKNFPEGNDLGPWDPKHFDVEDTAMAMITMKNGMLIYMETAWATNLIQPAMGVVAEICGNKAGADMVGPGFEDHVRLTRVVDGKLTTTTEKIEERTDMNAYDINHWIDAIQNDGDPAVLPEQAVTVVRVVEAIYKSAATGETVHF
ncbi:MAG: Gfo/Idh/MocA family oxidoreductase, partial [Bilifractor sp.]|nr:Gfo/Idh/MocA family oxidoreductase [Bilifractor sp.]